MKKILFSFVLVAAMANTANAQLNEYKYIIVPKKFQEFKNQNQYQTSTLIKYLFSQQGFNAVYDDQLPPDVVGDRCLALLTHLEDKSSLFATRTTLILKDCRGNEVFVTAEGRSKQKEYKEAYSEAIRDAFQSFGGITHNYTPKKKDDGPVTVSFKDDVKNLDEAKTAEKVVEQVATPQEQSYDNKAPQPSEMIKEPMVEKSIEAEPKAEANQFWYAQEIPNGFQLVDSSPKIRMKIFQTSVPDVFIGQDDTKKGIVYQKGGIWFFEYYLEGVRKVEEIKIKF